MQTLVRHIGKKKATPAACPECGWTWEDENGGVPKARGGPLTFDILSGLIAHEYAHKRFTVWSESAGENWAAYKTWYWSCRHQSGIAAALFDPNPLIQTIKANHDFFATVRIPLGGAE